MEKVDIIQINTLINVIIHCDSCYEEKVQGAVTVKWEGEGTGESE